MKASICAIWIDWYPYHVARFRALAHHPSFEGRAVGIELVGGAGVHQGMVFRTGEREGLNIQTLLPEKSWNAVKQNQLAGLLWRKLDELKPEAVLVPGYYTLPGIAAALWAKKNGRRSILMTESTAWDHDRTWWKEAAKSRLVRSLFDSAIAGGEAHREYLEILGFPQRETGRFYDVVDNRFYREGVRKYRREGPAGTYGLPEEYFLYVGRLAPEKNLSALLDAVGKLKADGWGGSLILVGDGPEREALRSQAAAGGYAESVILAGLRNAAELLPYYAYATAFVLPSTREPWGLVVNEAMAAGLPVIVSDCCGCSVDLVENGSNGLVFSPEESGGLRQALACMARMGPSDRERMGARSQQIVGNYSPESFAQEVVRLAFPNRSSFATAA